MQLPVLYSILLQFSMSVLNHTGAGGAQVRRSVCHAPAECVTHAGLCVMINAGSEHTHFTAPG